MASPLQRYDRYEYDRLAPEHRLCNVPLCNDTTLVVRGLWVHDVAHVASNRVISVNESGLYTLLKTFNDWHYTAWVQCDFPRGHDPSFRDNLHEFFGARSE